MCINDSSIDTQLISMIMINREGRDLALSGILPRFTLLSRIHALPLLPLVGCLKARTSRGQPERLVCLMGGGKLYASLLPTLCFDEGVSESVTWISIQCHTYLITKVRNLIVIQAIRMPSFNNHLELGEIFA